MFGEELRAAREGKGWSRRQLGGKVGCSGSTIGALEKGLWEPRAGLSGRLCEALGLKEDPWVVAVMGGRIPKRVTRGEAEAIVGLLRGGGSGGVGKVVRELSLGAPEW